MGTQRPLDSLRGPAIQMSRILAGLMRCLRKSTMRGGKFVSTANLNFEL